MTSQANRFRAARRWFTAAAIATASIGVGITGFATDRLDGIQTRWEDRLQPGLDTVDEPAIVVVAIDRPTIAAIGTGWPVARTVHAELIRMIARGAPAVIAYDVLFAEPRDGDEALASAMNEAPVVLASALTLRRGDGPPVSVDGVFPTQDLADAAAAVGHANVTLAADTGVVRSMPVYVVDGRGVAIPSLALAAVAIADGNDPLPVERPSGIQIGNRLVPAPDGELTINWSPQLGSGAEEEVSAIDVLRGTVEPGVFRDRIVVVGTTEPTLGDQHLVPVDRSGSTAGISVIANTANTIVTDSYLTRPQRWNEYVLIVAIGVLVGLAFAFARLTVATGLTLALLASTVGVETWRFHVAGERWNVVWPVVTAALVGLSMSGWRYVAEIRHRRRAWSLFSSYVPAEVVADLADRDRLGEAMASRRSTVSVLFCDLRGFTPIAAGLDPDDVRRLLDHYYDYAVGIIHARHGTVMQFVGDEVFAVFGAPIEHENDAAAAVACAVELQDRRGELDAVLADADLPTISFGIGVHRGLVTTAHVGTADRRQYSAMGDAVNVGSRLCGTASAGEVVASVRTVESIGTVGPQHRSKFAETELVDVKGIAEPVAIVRRAPH